MLCVVMATVYHVSSSVMHRYMLLHYIQVHFMCVIPAMDIFLISRGGEMRHFASLKFFDLELGFSYDLTLGQQPNSTVS